MMSEDQMKKITVDELMKRPSFEMLSHLWIEEIVSQFCPDVKIKRDILSPHSHRTARESAIKRMKAVSE